MLLKEVVFVFATVVIRCINNVERSGTKILNVTFSISGMLGYFFLARDMRCDKVSNLVGTLSFSC